MVALKHTSTRSHIDTYIWTWHKTGEHQPLSLASDFALIGSYDLNSWAWLASVCPRPCVHTNTVTHTVCSTSCVELSGWHHLQLQCQRVKGDQCLAATAPHPSALVWLCVCVCVCLSTLTTWPFWSSLLSLSFPACVLIHGLHTPHCVHCSPFASSSFSPFLVLNPCSSFSFDFLPSHTSLLLSSSHPPSLLLAQIDRVESLGLFVLPSETHIVSGFSPLSAVCVQPNREQQWPIPI